MPKLTLGDVPKLEPRPGDNRSPVTIELDADLVDFVLENCDVNIRLMLTTLDTLELPRDKCEMLVGHIEHFKKLRDLVRRAR